MTVLNRTDEELMQMWLIDKAPHCHEQKRRKRQDKEVVYRLRLTLAWTFTHPILQKFKNNILAHEWPSVLRQRLQREEPFLFAVVSAYALDYHKSPTFLVIPNDAQSIMLLRVDTQKSYDLQSGIRCFGPLPGRCMENYPIL